MAGRDRCPSVAPFQGCGQDGWGGWEPQRSPLAGSILPGCPLHHVTGVGDASGPRLLCHSEDKASSEWPGSHGCRWGSPCLLPRNRLPQRLRGWTCRHPPLLSPHRLPGNPNVSSCRNLSGTSLWPQRPRFVCIHRTDQGYPHETKTIFPVAKDRAMLLSLCLLSCRWPPGPWPPRLPAAPGCWPRGCRSAPSARGRHPQCAESAWHAQGQRQSRGCLPPL